MLNSLKDNIRVIDERIENKNYEISNRILDAERIFFMGFSYADENLAMLDIQSVLNLKQKIYGTTYLSEPNKIEKIKAKLMTNKTFSELQIENLECLGLLRKHL